MGHLEPYWHPWHDEMTTAEFCKFKHAIPNQEHQQNVLDQVWNVMFDSDEVILAFSMLPSPEAIVALRANGFRYFGYKNIKRNFNGDNVVRMCDVYSKVF